MDTGNADCGAARRGFRIAGGAIALALAGAAWGQVPGAKSVHGMVVRVGVAPIEQIQTLPGGRPERTMHAQHASIDRDHLVVALADERTGERIEKANVTATVSRLGMAEEHRELEAMPQPGPTTWGGYFDLREPGPYVIRVEVARPGDVGPAIARFVYANH
jgi:hypothetical protein